MSNHSPILAIPTNYKGVRFRSRLEAKWAAWFDLVGWKWIYEPIDLEGWAPDFALVGHYGPIYVEVKPILFSHIIRETTDHPRLPGPFDKAVNSSVSIDCDVLLVGLSPDIMDGYYAVGVCNEPIRKGVRRHWGGGGEKGFDAAMVKHDRDSYKITGFCSYSNDHTDRISGIHTTWHDSEVVQSTVDLWGQACNAVQWRGK